MNCLPIDKAIKLYQMIAPYLPNTSADDFNFIGTIIDNIKNSGNQRVYIEAIALMADVSFDEVLQYDPIKEALPMFVEGLTTVNFIDDLKSFCEKVGINAGS